MHKYFFYVKKSSYLCSAIREKEWTRKTHFVPYSLDVNLDNSLCNNKELKEGCKSPLVCIYASCIEYNIGGAVH